MAVYVCEVCHYDYDEGRENEKWDDLPENWKCPVCESGKSLYHSGSRQNPPNGFSSSVEIPVDLVRTSDFLEEHMADIHQIAESGSSIIEPMRTGKPVISWDEVLIKGAQLSRIPLNDDQPVDTRTVIGPEAEKPLIIETPVFVTHMSFGALSREVKIALSMGSAAAGTAVCSGEGGVLPESLEQAHRYIFEYVPNRYSVTDETFSAVDAVEIKFGQSAKPGMGGHLPGGKVTP